MKISSNNEIFTKDFGSIFIFETWNKALETRKQPDVITVISL